MGTDVDKEKIFVPVNSTRKVHGNIRLGRGGGREGEQLSHVWYDFWFVAPGYFVFRPTLFSPIITRKENEIKQKIDY